MTKKSKQERVNELQKKERKAELVESICTIGASGLTLPTIVAIGASLLTGKHLKAAIIVSGVWLTMSAGADISGTLRRTLYDQKVEELTTDKSEEN